MVRPFESDKVLLLFANVGTATNLDSQVCERQESPSPVRQQRIQYGTTLGLLPMDDGLVASYYIEGEIFGRYVLANVPDPKVAVMYQNDDSGKEYLAGFKHALEDKARSIVVAEASYESTDPTVDSQILQLAGSGANVFLNGGTPKFIAQAIRKARDIGWKPVQMCPAQEARLSRRSSRRDWKTR